MIYIIRHGQTEQNVAHRIQGQRDFPLNETGEAQAREAGEKLAARGIVFDRAYSSPLSRAYRTAEIVATWVPVTPDDRLREMTFGPYEGGDLTNLPPELLAFFRDPYNVLPPEGVETPPELIKRLGSFLEDLRAELRDTTEMNVLVSTHAIALKAALEYLDPASRGRWLNTFVKNCGVFVFDLVEGEFTLPEELEL